MFLLRGSPGGCPSWQIITSNQLTMNKKLPPKIQLLQKVHLSLHHLIDHHYHPSIWNKQRKQADSLLCGDYYITQRQVDELRVTVHNIFNACEHGLKGDSPEWFEREEGEPAWCPYEEILYNLNDHRTGWLVQDLSPEIRTWMRRFGEMDNMMGRAFDAFLKGHKITTYRMDGDTATPMTKDEIGTVKLNRQLTNIELAAIEPEWAADMRKVKKIATEKGNLAAIIQLL